MTRTKVSEWWQRSMRGTQVAFCTSTATLEGSFSAGSKPNFASKYAFESSRRDLHNYTMHSFAQLCNFNIFSKRIAKHLANFCKTFKSANSANFKFKQLEKCDFRAVQRSALCRARRELSNAYLVTKFGFDTAENEPSKVLPTDARDAGDAAAASSSVYCIAR